MIKTFTEKVKEEIIGLKRQSVLQKYFIEHGLVYDPEKEYHLDFNFNNQKDANKVITELLKKGIEGKLSINNRNRYIVYIVDYESILSVLKILKARKSYKTYEKVIKVKSHNAYTERVVNFETANIKKSVNAGLTQVEDIKKLLKKYKLKNLSASLQEVVIARKKNPTLSLDELAKKMGNVTKSSLNHRFIKIRKLIEE